MWIDLIHQAGPVRPIERQSPAGTQYNHSLYSSPDRVGAESSSTSSPVDERQLEEVVKQVNEVLSPFNIFLKFSRDDQSGSIVVEMIDQITGETLRQIPDEAELRLSAALGSLQGLVVNRKA